MLDGDGAVYVAQRPSPHAMRLHRGRPTRQPPQHRRRQGAAQHDDRRGGHAARRAHGTADPHPKSLATLPDLLADLATIRQQGYAVDDEEQELGVRCYALAVPGIGAPVALSVSGPLARVDLRFAARALPILRARARTASAPNSRAAERARCRAAHTAWHGPSRAAWPRRSPRPARLSGAAARGSTAAWWALGYIAQQHVGATCRPCCVTSRSVLSDRRNQRAGRPTRRTSRWSDTADPAPGAR